MDTSTHTPTWMVALIAVMSVALTVLLLLFLVRQAQAAVLREEQSSLKEVRPLLRSQLSAANDLLPQLADEIARKRRLLEAARESESVMNSDILRIRDGNQGLNKAILEALDQSTQAHKQLMTKLPEGRQELMKSIEEAFAAERRNDAKRAELRANVEAESQALEASRKKQRLEGGSDKGRVSELEDRLKRISNQTDLSAKTLSPDGQILAGQAKDGYVVINRGFRDNLQTGIKFTVFTRRAGDLVTKGQIVVERMEPRIAVCRVLEEKDGNDPLIPGDLIHNPSYDPQRVRSFALRGVFRRFSIDELSRLITDAGFTVVNDLGPGTDFLVAGEGADAAVAQASKLGIATTTEERLVVYLRPVGGPDPRTWDYLATQARAGARFGFVGTFNRVPEAVIRKALSDLGGKVRGGVAAGMAAVIAGDDALESMTKAGTLGVPVVPQDQFIDLATVAH